MWFICGKWLFLIVGDILGEGGVLAVSGILGVLKWFIGVNGKWGVCGLLMVSGILVVGDKLGLVVYCGISCKFGISGIAVVSKYMVS